MNNWERATCETVIEKLDHNACTLSFAKSYLWAYTGIEVKGRTKAQFIKNLCQLMKKDKQ